MLKLVRQLHIYSGLLTFSALILFGGVGVYASFQDQNERPVPTREVVPFEYPDDTPAEAEREMVAALVMERFGNAQTTPMQHWMMDATGPRTYQVRLYGPSEEVTVDVDLADHTAAVARISRDLGEYAVVMHETVPLDDPAPLVLLWSLYMQASIAFLGFLVLSGIYLWAASRPGHLGGRLGLAAGTLLTGAFLVAFLV